MLPYVYTQIYAIYPSGLVLNWVENNDLSIAKQWYITHRNEKAAVKA